VSFATQFATRFKNVYLHHETRQGIAYALNTGLEFCRGKYIARMDADDVMLPGRLQLQNDFLDKNPGSGLVSGLVKTNHDLTGTEGMNHFTSQINEMLSEQEIYHHRFVESPFAHPSVMFRKSLIEQFGNYSTAGGPEDYELWLRWFSNGVRMNKLPVEVIYWRDHASRLTRNHPDYSRAGFALTRLHYLAIWIQNHWQNKPIWIWGGGKYSRKSALALIDQGIPISGFIDVFTERKIPGYRVMHFSNIPPSGQIFIISMISNRGKFKEVKLHLTGLGYEPDRDFILAG
jgi:glycosyltransferase involved in cell wall biosynthesis